MLKGAKMRLVCFFANETSPPVRRSLVTFSAGGESNIKTVAITNNQEVHPHPSASPPLSRCGSGTTRLCLPPAAIHYRVAASLPALGKAYAKRNSSIIYRRVEQFVLTNGTSRAPSPTNAKYSKPFYGKQVCKRLKP